MLCWSHGDWHTELRSRPLEYADSDIQWSVKSMWRVNMQEYAIDVGSVRIATALCRAVQCSSAVGAYQATSRCRYAAVSQVGVQ
jgi:hypothetical protein